MTPRHPPRALRSLTTPTRPPSPTGSPTARIASGPSRRRSSLPSDAAARGVSRRCGPPHLGNDPRGDAGRFPATGHASVRAPLIRGEICYCHYHADSRGSTCLRDRPPDCQRATEGRRRSRPGSTPGPDLPGPAPGRRPGGEAAVEAAPPRTQRSARADESDEHGHDRPPRHPGAGDRRRSIAGRGREDLRWEAGVEAG